MDFYFVFYKYTDSRYTESVYKYTDSRYTRNFHATRVKFGQVTNLF